MVLRNLSPADRLMNGTMGIVRAIHTFWIWLETESGLHVIPRINFTINIKRCNYVCNRRQFPLRLAYCKTVHKAQGATLKRLGGDLREDPFSHGQLYVLLGRSRNSESAAVLVHPEMKDGDGTALTANIVFNELLTRSDCKCPLEVLHDHSPLTPVLDSAWEMKRPSPWCLVLTPLLLLMRPTPPWKMRTPWTPSPAAMATTEMPRSLTQSILAGSRSWWALSSSCRLRGRPTRWRGARSPNNLVQPWFKTEAGFKPGRAPLRRKGTGPTEEARFLVRVHQLISALPVFCDHT